MSPIEAWKKHGLTYEKGIVEESITRCPPGRLAVEQSLRTKKLQFRRLAVRKQIARKKIVITNWQHATKKPNDLYLEHYRILLQEGFKPLYVWNGKGVIPVTNLTDLKSALYTITPIHPKKVIKAAASVGLSSDEIEIVDCERDQDLLLSILGMPIGYPLFNNLESHKILGNIPIRSGGKEYHFKDIIDSIDFARLKSLTFNFYETKDIKHLEGQITSLLTAFKQVKCLQFDNLAVKSLDDFAFLCNVFKQQQHKNNLSKVTEIGINDSSITLSELKQLLLLFPNITLLRLMSCTNINEEHIAALTREFPNLEIRKTYYDNFRVYKGTTTSGPHEFERPFYQSEENKNSLSHDLTKLKQDDLIAKLTANPFIEALYISPENLAGLNKANLPRLPYLRRLVINGNSWKLENILEEEFIAFLNLAPNLEELCLLSCHIQEGAGKLKLDQKPKLSYCSIEGSQPTANILIQLLRTASNLSSLNLSSSILPTIENLDFSLPTIKHLSWNGDGKNFNEKIMTELINAMPNLEILSCWGLEEKNALQYIYPLTQLRTFELRGRNLNGVAEPLRAAVGENLRLAAIQDFAKPEYEFSSTFGPSSGKTNSSKEHKTEQASVKGSTSGSVLRKPRLFGQNKGNSLDANTEMDLTKVLSAQIHFQTSRKLAIPNYYRIEVYDQLKVTHNAIIPERSIRALEPRTPRCIDDEKYNLECYFKTKKIPQEWLGEKKLDPDYLAWGEELVGRDWQVLPSLSANELLLGYQKADVEFGYDSQLNLWLVRALNKDKPVKLKYLLYAERNVVNGKFASLMGRSFGKDLDEIINKCSNFVPGKLAQKIPNLGQGLIEALIKDPKGACRHRAYVFKYLADQKGIPCRLLMNDLHVLVEVQPPGSKEWVMIELGGAPVRQDIKPFQSIPEEKKVSNSPYQEIKKGMEQIAIETPAVAKTPHHMAKAETKLSELLLSSQLPTTDFTAFCDALMMRLQRLPENKRQFILTFSNQDQILAFKMALQEYLANKEQNFIYRDSLGDLEQEKNICIEKNGFKEINGGVLNFLSREEKKQSATGIFMLNCTKSKPEHIAYNSLYDDRRKINTNDIPHGAGIFACYETPQAKTLREDLRSRFGEQQIIEVPDTLQLPSTKALAAVQAETKDPLNLYQSTDWESELVGEITANAGKLACVEGLLVKLSRPLGFESKDTAVTKKEITILNPPWHLRAFQLFWSEICSSRTFEFNGIIYRLPDSVHLNWRSQAYQVPKDILSLEPLNRDNEKLLQYALNATDHPDFFKVYASDSGKQLESKLGLLSSHAKSDTMIILVTEALEDGQWAKLIDKAQELKRKLRFILAPGVELPEFLQPYAADWYASHLKATPKPTRLDEKIIDTLPDQAITIVQSNDIDYSQTLIMKRLKQSANEVHVFAINEEMGYELIEQWESKEEEVKDSLFAPIQCRASQILELLKSGKTVLFRGSLSAALARRLETLFMHQPHLYCGGVAENIKGRLVILTKNDEYFNFTANRFEHISQQLQYWSALKQQFNPKHCDLLKKLCAELQLSELSYMQLQTMLVSMQKDVIKNPLESFFLLDSQQPLAKVENSAKLYKQCLTEEKLLQESKGEEKIAAISDELSQRLRDISIILKDNPYVFLIGPAGTGKSSVVLKDLKKFYAAQEQKANLYVGWEKFETWARSKDGNLNILFIDDDLAKTGAYDFLEGLFQQPPRVFYQGEWYDLGPNQKIVFAGNYYHYQNRQPQALFQNHGNIYHFPEFSREYICQHQVLPLLKEFCPDLEEHFNRLATLFMDALYIARDSAKDRIITTRNLQTMVLLFAEAWQRNKAEIVAEATVFGMQPDFQGIAKWAAYEIARDLFTEEADLEFCQKFNLTENDRHYELLFAKAAYEFKGKNFTPTANHSRTLKVLQEELNIRTLRLKPFLLLEQKRLAAVAKEDKHAIKAIETEQAAIIAKQSGWGTRGLQLEGPSGTGKSSVACHLLDSLGYVKNKDYYHIAAANPQAMKELLIKAFHEGAIVILDEINSLPLEDVLNALMMGVDPDGNPAQRPGFMVIATQNPIDFPGRQKLSEALENRFRKLQLRDYQIAELLKIITHKCDIPQPVAQCLVYDHLKRKETASAPPTTRDLLRKAEDQHLVASLAEVLELPPKIDERKKEDRAPASLVTKFSSILPQKMTLEREIIANHPLLPVPAQAA